MRALLTVAVAAAWLAGGAYAAAASAPAPQHAASTHTVIIEGMGYHPAKIVVRRGEKVKWVNKGLFPHTVTAADGRFDSGTIRPGGAWTYVPGKAGEYDYKCAFHPTMKGRLIVR